MKRSLIYLTLGLMLSACKNTTLGNDISAVIAPPVVADQTLPSNFDPAVPIFPKAKLQTAIAPHSQNIFSTWQTPAPKAEVVKFYEAALEQWQPILRSPPENGITNYVMQKADLILTVTIQAMEQSSTTAISLQYLRSPNSLTPSDPSKPPNLEPPSLISSSSSSFSDEEMIPAPLRAAIADLQKLGTITPKQENQFRPNDLIQRREYARWLVNTNNRLYANRPARQIRLADSPATFVDVPTTDPDFAVIQALVNAGLIPAAPSRRFRPNEPVNREVFLQWKVPLDVRTALPDASLSSVKQAWGFQDSDRLSPSSYGVVLADFKLGDFSNFRRSFGFTTLFQPQKSVTRAEAAAALWHFGTPDDGLSAQAVLQSETEKLP